MKQTDYRKKNNRSKLNMTMIALVVSLVVLIMAAFAWYTLSTNPEIKGMSFRVNAEQAVLVSQDGKKFFNSEDLSENFSDMEALVPVSTVDGMNWFVCKYDMNGNVLQKADKATYGTQFEYMRFPNGGNKKKTSDTGSTGTEEMQQNATNDLDHNYYIYTDIWLKTEAERATVYLSVPNGMTGSEKRSYTQDDTEQDHYGSYVMSYHVKDNEENKGTDGTDNTQQGTQNTGKTQEITLTSGGSETCARVGFLVNPSEVNTNTADTATPDFYIYEPNADRRSEVDKSSNEYDADKYIAGFNSSTFYSKNGQVSYQEANGYYFPTYPVAKNANDEDGHISVFPSDHLLVQKGSDWNINQTATQSEQDKFSFNSGMIDKMGKFLDTSSLYNKMNLTTEKSLSEANSDYTIVNTTEQQDGVPSLLRSSTPIVTLTKDTPVKVRLYFWLEGQDVDCWNDIADTDFLVNLEFVGDVSNQ